jgi:hypothetical protein
MSEKDFDDEYINPVENPALPPSREGKRALQIKSELIGLLVDVTEAMESAREEGFDVVFTIGKNEKGHNVFDPQIGLVISKKW